MGAPHPSGIWALSVRTFTCVVVAIPTRRHVHMSGGPCLHSSVTTSYNAGVCVSVMVHKCINAASMYRIHICVYKAGTCM